jgi:hypothetical protein
MRWLLSCRVPPQCEGEGEDEWQARKEAQKHGGEGARRRTGRGGWKDGQDASTQTQTERTHALNPDICTHRLHARTDPFLGAIPPGGMLPASVKTVGGPPYTQYPFPPRSLVWCGQTSPRKPRLVVSRTLNKHRNLSGRGDRMLKTPQRHSGGNGIAGAWTVAGPEGPENPKKSSKRKALGDTATEP